MTFKADHGTVRKYQHLSSSDLSSYLDARIDYQLMILIHPG